MIRDSWRDYARSEKDHTQQYEFALLSHERACKCAALLGATLRETFPSSASACTQVCLSAQ